MDSSLNFERADSKSDAHTPSEYDIELNFDAPPQIRFSLSDLPNDVIIADILPFFLIHDLMLNVSRLNRRFRELCTSDVIWIHLKDRMFRDPEHHVAKNLHEEVYLTVLDLLRRRPSGYVDRTRNVSCGAWAFVVLWVLLFIGFLVAYSGFAVVVGFAERDSRAFGLNTRLPTLVFIEFLLLIKLVRTLGVSLPSCPSSFTLVLFPALLFLSTVGLGRSRSSQQIWNELAGAETLLKNGTIIRFDLGDELVWNCLPPSQLELIANAVRKSFPTAIIWSNEAWPVLNGQRNKCGGHSDYQYRRLSPGSLWICITMKDPIRSL